MDSKLNSRERLNNNAQISHRHLRKTGRARAGGKPAWPYYENTQYKPSSVWDSTQTGHETPPGQSPFIPQPPRRCQQFVHTITRLSAGVSQPELSKPGFLGCLEENVILR